jgi:hypothetical protein
MRPITPFELQKLRIDLQESRAQCAHTKEDIQCIIRNARDIITQSRELIAKVDALTAGEIGLGRL